MPLEPVGIGPVFICGEFAQNLGSFGLHHSDTVGIYPSSRTVTQHSQTLTNFVPLTGMNSLISCLGKQTPGASFTFGNPLTNLQEFSVKFLPSDQAN